MDVIAETGCDILSAKYITVVLPDGERMEVEKWKEHSVLRLEQNGVRKMRQKDFMRTVDEAIGVDVQFHV